VITAGFRSFCHDEGSILHLLLSYIISQVADMSPVDHYTLEQHIYHRDLTGMMVPYLLLPTVWGINYREMWLGISSHCHVIEL
jgi:hypothetical protein